MAKKRVVPKKRVAPSRRRGPAPTGRGIQIGERWHPPEIAAIDAWIAASTDRTITRAHAVRRLVALGLSVKQQPHASGRGQRDRAASLANVQMDRMADTSASAEDQETRKGRLLKGPSNFRDVRRDRSK
jgi:hypothetical protein